MISTIPLISLTSVSAGTALLSGYDIALVVYQWLPVLVGCWCVALLHALPKMTEARSSLSARLSLRVSSYSRPARLSRKPLDPPIMIVIYAVVMTILSLGSFVQMTINITSVSSLLYHQAYGTSTVRKFTS